MRQKLTQHWYNHRHKYASVFTMIILLISGSVINLSLIRNHLGRSFNRTFETFSYSGLETYNSGTASVLNNLYSNSLLRIQDLSADDGIIKSLTAQDYHPAQLKFEDYRRLNPTFNSVVLLDAKGIIRAIDGDVPNPSIYIGHDDSKTAHVTQILSSNKPYTSEVWLSPGNRDIVSFGVPIVSGSGQLGGILIGNITVDQIVKLLNIPTDNNGYHYSVVDIKGNLIVDNGSSPKGLVNILDTEGLMKKLQQSDQAVAQEINYLNQSVFAIGSKLKLPLGNTSIYLLSYYDKNIYSQSLASLKSEANRFYFSVLGLVNIVWVVTSLAALLYIKKRYDKK